MHDRPLSCYTRKSSVLIWERLPVDEQAPAHEMRESESREVRYPDHPPRTESALYKKTHHELCVVQNLPCFVCGKKHPEVTTETHHFFAEWAAMSAVDWIRFGQMAKYMPNPQTGAYFHDLFDWEEVQQDPSIFVDSVYNMIVLCPDHHRSETYGIHHTPFPEWFLQAFPLNGFEFLEPEGK